MGSIKYEALNGVKWSSVNTVYVALMKVLQVAILARYLNKEDFGLMGLAVLVNTFCMIFVDMGLAAAAMHQTNLTKKRFSSFYWFNIAFGLLFTCCAVLASPLIADYYHRPDLMVIISFTSLLIFINSTFSLQRILQQKKMNFRFLSIVDILSASLMLCSNTFFAMNGFGVYSLVWSSLLGALFLSFSYLGLDIFKEHNIKMHFKLSDVKEAMKIGSFQVGSSILDFGAREMDSLIISSSYSMELFGVYTLCKQITMRVFFIINPIITNVATPIFAKIQEDKSRVNEMYVKIVRIIGFMNFPIYSIMACCSVSLLALLYGDSYMQYSYILFFLCLYYAFQSIGNPVGSLLVGLGRTDYGFYWTIFRICFAGVYLYFLSMLDLHYFVFFVFLLSIIMLYPSWSIVLHRVIDIKFSTTFGLSFIPFLVCVPLFSLYWLDKYIGMPLLSIPIIAVVFCLGYLLISFIFRKQFTIYVFRIIFKSKTSF